MAKSNNTGLSNQRERLQALAGVGAGAGLDAGLHGHCEWGGWGHRAGYCGGVCTVGPIIRARSARFGRQAVTGWDQQTESCHKTVTEASKEKSLLKAK